MSNTSNCKGTGELTAKYNHVILNLKAKIKAVLTVPGFIRPNKLCRQLKDIW